MCLINNLKLKYGINYALTFDIGGKLEITYNFIPIIC